MSDAKIKRALVSVSDKTGLLELGQALAAADVEILSTGGSAKALRDAGVPVTEVSDFTGFPEIMDGRVKTLQPKIHGGLLAVRGNAEHEAAMQEHDIAPIDLLVVNLYPFEETVAKGANFDTCIENIDIGGPAMIRAASKNHAFVTVVVDSDDYAQLVDEMSKNNGATTAQFRTRLAAKAYARTGSYDAAISAGLLANWARHSQHAKLCPANFVRSFDMVRTRISKLHFIPQQKTAPALPLLLSYRVKSLALTI